MSERAAKLNLYDKFIKEKEETVILLRNIPATVVSLFVVSVICMNLLANKTQVGASRADICFLQRNKYENQKHYIYSICRYHRMRCDGCC